MRLELSQGPAHVKINHNLWSSRGQRITHVSVDFEADQNTVSATPVKSYSGTCKCSKKDHFCRRTGRKLALERMLAVANGDFTRDDRRKLWKAVCPDLHKS